VHTDAVDSVLGTKKAEAMGQFDLFGGADTAADAVFAIKVPDEEWEDKPFYRTWYEWSRMTYGEKPTSAAWHVAITYSSTVAPDQTLLGRDASPAPMPVAPSRAKQQVIQIYLNDDHVPILPHVNEDDNVKGMQKIFRAFVTAYYRNYSISQWTWMHSLTI